MGWGKGASAPMNIACALLRFNNTTREFEGGIA
jgi:hypothetical protein